MADKYDIVSRKTVVDISGEYARASAEQTGVVNAAFVGNLAVRARVEVFYEGKAVGNGSTVRVWLLNRCYAWAEVDKYGPEGMALVRKVRAEVAANAQKVLRNLRTKKLPFAPDASVADPAVLERLVYASLDESLRETIKALGPVQERMPAADVPDEVHIAFAGDFTAAWDFVVDLMKSR
jgi:hypothetical protein